MDYEFYRFAVFGCGYVSCVSDGSWLAFSSESSLTGYDNRDAKSGLPDSEVYLYNAVSGKLVCASCNPSNARPVGSAEVPLSTQIGGSRSLFDSGRLFFNSAGGLVPQDSNGNWDVYEYEPVGWVVFVFYGL